MRKFFAISDLHLDFKQNKQKFLDYFFTHHGEHRNDVCLLAGDISHKNDEIEFALRLLSKEFYKIFYTVGNHELWVQKKEHLNSIEKFNAILNLCDRYRICTKPECVDGVVVYPLFSWYNDSLAQPLEKNHPSLNTWMDFYLCQWPELGMTLHDYFMQMNEEYLGILNEPKTHVVTMSHFVPRRDLIPSTDKLLFKGLACVSGSNCIEHFLRKIGSCVHVFGHTHIDVDVKIDGVRYVQHCLGYPDEKSVLTKFQLKEISFTPKFASPA